MLTLGIWTAFVGQTPWSARVPLDPPVDNENKADEGVGRGPGGPPHFECKLYDIGNSRFSRRTLR